MQNRDFVRHVVKIFDGQDIGIAGFVVVEERSCRGLDEAVRDFRIARHRLLADLGNPGDFVNRQAEIDHCFNLDLQSFGEGLGTLQDAIAVTAAKRINIEQRVDGNREDQCQKAESQDASFQRIFHN